MSKSNKQQAVVTVAQVQSIIPEMDQESYAELKANIAQVGQLVPAVVDKAGNIIDGRARAKICDELGIELNKVVLPENLNGATCAADINLFRRHLTLGQKAFIAASLANLSKGANQHTATAGCSRKEAAKITGISQDSIDRAGRIKNGGSDKLVEKVLKDEISLSAADELVKKVPDKDGQDRILRKDIDFFARSFKREAKLTDKRDEAKKLMANNAAALSAFDGKYSVIYADPPWDYGGVVGSYADPKAIYPVMKLDEIKALPVKKCLTDDAALFMWVPNTLIPSGLEVLTEYGFEFVSTMVWCKDNAVGADGPTKTAHETLLIGKKGKSFHINDERILSWHHEKRSNHSKKPEVFAKMLDAMYPGLAKLEMFAREPRSGEWTVFGNEVVNTTVPEVAEQNPVAKPIKAVRVAKPRKPAKVDVVPANDADFKKAA